jgi:2'-5' RNA ligase
VKGRFPGGIIKMRERYENSYTGIPLPESLQLSWAWQLMFIIEKGWFSELSNKNLSPHITIYYLGNINAKQLERGRNLISDNLNILQESLLSAKGLGIIGTNKRALVIRMNDSEALIKFRKQLENALPKFVETNFPLLPHITISELKTRRSIERARKLLLNGTSQKFSNFSFPITNVDLFYKNTQ